MKCTRRPEAAEIRFLRALLGLTTLDKSRNTETEATTRKKKKKNILKEIEEYRSD
jgi:hypothetical protein